MLSTLSSLFSLSPFTDDLLMLAHRRRLRVHAIHLSLLCCILLLVLIFDTKSNRKKASWEADTTYTSAAESQNKERERSPLSILSQTLDRLDNTTVLPYAEALKYNEQTCAGRGIQSNSDQVKGEVAFWRSLTPELIQEKRHALVQGVKAAFGLPEALRAEDSHTMYPNMWGKGRGIVYTGGNADTMQRLHTSLRILRNRHKCKLPVEVFCFPEEMESSQGLRQEIEALGGVTFKELHSSPKLKTWKNFQIKGEAVVESSFAEVLYLDSDNILLADPTYLFDHPVYKEHGAVFWPDITKDGPANPIWRILGQQCRRNDWQIDSGQMLIDKGAQQGLNLAALVVASMMQKDHEFWFKISGGDKDTFRYGFYALDLPWTPAPHWLSSYGNMHNYEKDGHRFCGLAMFQYGLSPADWKHFPQATPSPDFKSTHAPPLFAHANLLKHSSGYLPGQTFTTVKRFKYDNVSEDMDRPRTNVYHSWQGMCVDLWDAFDDINPREHVETDAEGKEIKPSFENGDVITEDSNVAFGGALEGFESMFYAEGGKAGGF